MAKWTNHRNGQRSIKITSGDVATRGKVWQDAGKRWCACIHGKMLTNPEAVDGPGDYGFLACYDWGSEEAAKAAILARATPRD